MAALSVTVVSADAALWSGEASRISARTVDGSIGILPGHEPVLAVLDRGEVRVLSAGGDLITVALDGGFLSVADNVVTVAADSAELVS